MPSALKPLIALARADPAGALRRARGEPHPANRCQFLAWVAHFAPERDAAAIAREALDASARIDNDYWSVAIAAWPLRALVERGYATECARALGPVLRRAAAIAHPVSRMGALELLLHAVFAVASARELVVGALLEACASADSWKVPRCLARTAVILAGSPAESNRVLAVMPEGRHKRSARREIAAGGRAPRSFFV